MPTSPPDHRRRWRPSARARRVALLVMALTPFAVAHGQTPAGVGSTDLGYLTAFSDPAGAYVYVDSTLLGTAPVGPVAVRPGEYRVWFRTRSPEFFEPEPLPERRVTVVAGDTSRVVERMGHLLRIETEPLGAMVMLGDRVIGRTPLELRWRPARGTPGSEIQLVRTHYHPGRISPIELNMGGTISRRLTPIDPDIDPGIVTTGGGGGANWKAWGLLTLSAASAGAALYFKEQANTAYESYLDSAIPDDQIFYLDEANQYDRYAATAWVGAEVTFVLSAWLFVRGALKMDRVRLAPTLEMDADRTAVGARWRY